MVALVLDGLVGRLKDGGERDGRRVFLPQPSTPSHASRLAPHLPSPAPSSLAPSPPMRLPSAPLHLSSPSPSPPMHLPSRSPPSSLPPYRAPVPYPCTRVPCTMYHIYVPCTKFATNHTFLPEIWISSRFGTQGAGCIGAGCRGTVQGTVQGYGTGVRYGGTARGYGTGRCGVQVQGYGYRVWGAVRVWGT